jgi:hypothetical protein
MLPQFNMVRAASYGRASWQGLSIKGIAFA